MKIEFLKRITQERRDAKRQDSPETFKRHRITMIALIIKGGSLLALAENNYQRLSYPFKKRNCYRHTSGLHSELAVINKCTASQLKGSTIVIYGLGGLHPPRSSKPCSACMKAIKSVGIKKIIYFENEIQKKMMVNSLDV
jgi:tRNA(Arg) A34 adenosine deaminase TadA